MKYAEFKVEPLFEESYTMRMKYEEVTCKFCGSPNVVKNGVRNGVQYWLCKNCGRGFVDNKGLPNMRYSVDDVASAIYQYYTGSSLSEIRGHIEQHSRLRPSDSTIYSWLTRFTKIAMDKTREYTPKVGDVWVADETVLRVGGKRIDRKKKGVWFWDTIDAQTRFLLASHISSSRTAKDAITLMEKALERAGKFPQTVITDKLQAYLDATITVFGTKRTEHIQSKGFTGGLVNRCVNVRQQQAPPPV
jgi:putative transposase